MSDVCTSLAKMASRASHTRVNCVVMNFWSPRNREVGIYSICCGDVIEKTIAQLVTNMYPLYRKFVEREWHAPLSYPETSLNHAFRYYCCIACIQSELRLNDCLATSMKSTQTPLLCLLKIWIFSSSNIKSQLVANIYISYFSLFGMASRNIRMMRCRYTCVEKR